MRSRLTGNEDGHPMLFFFDTCFHSIRTIPALQHDEDRPEDLDTTAEDHAADETRYRAGLHRYFSAATKAARLTAERDAAYVSLAYNAGVAGIGKSTATRRLNAGDIRGGCKALGWWNKAGGRVVRGLVNRRADETRLCLIGAT